MYMNTVHNNVLKNSYREFKNTYIYMEKQGEFAGLFRRFFHFRRSDTLYVLSVYVVSHYNFCPYALCPFDVLSLYVLSLYILS